MLSTKELKTRLQEKYASSTLTDAHARKLRLQALTPQQTQGKVPTAGPLCSMYIPYFDPAGMPTNFFRLRYLEEPTGFQVVKPQRYVQPKGSLNEVYLPPLLPVPWSAVLQDPAQLLYITEGELKAAAGCAAGLPVMGLGGVDVWRSKQRGIPLLPALADAAWANRRVCIVYDSDLASNPNVLRAQNQLASALTNLGAVVHLAMLPQPEDPSAKYGLDDYILANGADKLKELLATAPATEESRALATMNERVAFVEEPGLIIRLDTGQTMNSHAYINDQFAPYRHNLAALNGSVKQVSTAKRWMEWKHRFALRRITYKPGEERITSGREWNGWEGWGCAPKAGSTAPWVWLMNFIFKEELNSRRWFEQWLAYPLQHPGTKLFTAALIWGTAQGTGKTLVGHTMLRLYGKNGSEIKSRNLKGNFNSWAKDKQFVLGDEVTGNDQRDHADMLKGMITQQQMEINIKYVAEYSIPDCVNYLFTSNHCDAFFLDDSDRRFFVHELVGQPAERKEYEAYDRWYRSEDGAAALFDYLLNLDTSSFNPRAEALVTDSKQAMIRDVKSDVAVWVADLQEEPAKHLQVWGTRAAEGCDLFSPEQLRHAYDPEYSTKVVANGLGRELKRGGLPQVNKARPVRTSAGLLRLYAVRNADHWVDAEPGVLAQHWDSFFGPQAKKY